MTLSVSTEKTFIWEKINVLTQNRCSSLWWRCISGYSAVRYIYRWSESTSRSRQSVLAGLYNEGFSAADRWFNVSLGFRFKETVNGSIRELPPLMMWCRISSGMRRGGVEGGQTLKMQWCFRGGGHGHPRKIAGPPQCSHQFPWLTETLAQ